MKEFIFKHPFISLVMFFGLCETVNRIVSEKAVKRDIVIITRNVPEVSKAQENPPCILLQALAAEDKTNQEA